MLCLILKTGGCFFVFFTVPTPRKFSEVLRRFDSYLFVSLLFFFFFNAVLQLCLQQRRTREQLVEQGIMPREYSDHTITVHSACMTR